MTPMDTLTTPELEPSPDPGSAEGSPAPAAPPSRWLRLDWLLLAVLVALVVASNSQWLSLDARAPDSDTGHHFTKSWRCFTLLTAPPGPWQGLAEFYAWPTVFPPLLYLLASVAYWHHGGFSMHAWLYASLLAWPVLVLYTWRLGRLLWGTEAGVLAAVVACTSPLLLVVSRKFFMEFPLAALMAACLYYLLASEGFSRRWESWLFGLFLGLALMVKWTSLVYLCGAAVVALAGTAATTWRASQQGRAVLAERTAMALLVLWMTLNLIVPRDDQPVTFTPAMFWSLVGGAAILAFSQAGRRQVPKGDPEAWLNVLQAFALAWMLAAPWYLMHLQQLSTYYPDISYVAPHWENDPAIDSFAGRLFYTYAFKSTWGLPFVLLFLVGLVQGIRRAARGDRGMLALLLTLVGFYLVGSSITNKEVRYLIPLTPVLACFTGCWLAGLGRWRWLATVPLVLLCMARLWGWALPESLANRLEGAYLQSDSLAATAGSLPGLPEGYAVPSTWSEILTLPDMPWLGSTPRDAGWDDTDHLEENGP